MLRKSLAALCIAAIAAASAAEEKWYCGNQNGYNESYVIKNGKKIYDSRRKADTSRFERIIDKSKRKISKMEFHDNGYLHALYTFKYFDWKKAADDAWILCQAKELKKRDIDLFVRALRRSEFISFYAKQINVDPRQVLLTDIVESHVKNEIGDAGEIGEMQIMPKTFEKSKKTYESNPYWIEGSTVTHPINNLIFGADRIATAANVAKCSGKSLYELSGKKIIEFYAFYSRGRLDFYEGECPLDNIAAEFKHHAYMLDCIFKLSQADDFMTEKGRKLYEKACRKSKQVKLARETFD